MREEITRETEITTVLMLKNLVWFCQLPLGLIQTVGQKGWGVVLPSVKGSGTLSAVWGGAPSEMEFGTF